MRRFALFVVVMLILIAGGGLTAQLAASNNDPGNFLPFLKQTADPNASVFDAVPWKSEQFFLFAGFVLFNLVGMGVTIAVVMWYLNREIARSRARVGGETRIQTTESETAAEES